MDEYTNDFRDKNVDENKDFKKILPEGYEAEEKYLLENLPHVTPENNPEAFVPVPPDGGWGWVVVFACFMNNFIVDGLSYSYGVLLVELSDYFQESKSKVSLIGSLLCGMAFIAGPIAGALVNSFGCRTVCIMGSIISCLFFLISTQAPSVNVLVFTYGIMGGIGFGLIYLPTMISVSYYFEKKRSLATGIAAVGSGLGSIIFPIFLQTLLNIYDWTNAMFILAGIALNCAVFGSLVRELEPEISLEKALKEPSLFQKFKAFISCKKIKHEVGNETMGSRRSSLRRSSDLGGSIYMSQKLIGDSYLDNIIMQHAQQYLIQSMASEEKDKMKSFSRSAHHLPNVNISMTGINMQEIKNPENSTNRGVHSSTPDLGTDKIRNLHSPWKPYQVQLPQNVTRKDFSRPLYRKDVFYSGSIFQLNRHDVINRNLITSPATDSKSQIGSTWALMMTRIPGARQDGQEEKEKPDRCDRILPKAIKDVFSTMTDLSLFKNSGYTIIWLSNILIMIGFYVPVFFLIDYSISQGISKSKSATIQSVLGISNTLGKFLLGAVAGLPCTSALQVSNLSLLTVGILTCLLPFLTNFIFIMGFSALYGFFCAPFMALTSVMLCDFLGLEKLTNAFGLITLARGISGSLGPPLAGAMMDSLGGFHIPFYFSGAVQIIGALMYCLLFLPKYRRQADNAQEELSKSVFSLQKSIISLNSDTRINIHNPQLPNTLSHGFQGAI